jgi:hypothetical protein
VRASRQRPSGSNFDDLRFQSRLRHAPPRLRSLGVY